MYLMEMQYLVLMFFYIRDEKCFEVLKNISIPQGHPKLPCSYIILFDLSALSTWNELVCR